MWMLATSAGMTDPIESKLIRSPGANDPVAAHFDVVAAVHYIVRNCKLRGASRPSGRNAHQIVPLGERRKVTLALSDVARAKLARDGAAPVVAIAAAQP